MQVGSKRPLGEINITPMVDVVLVLLIIFMVAAPMIQQGVAVQLPSVKGQTLDVHERQTVFTLTRTKQIYLGEVEIPLAELGDKLRGNLKLADGGQVVLHADRLLDYGFVVDVMGALQAAGVSNVGLATDPRGQPATPIPTPAGPLGAAGR